MPTELRWLGHGAWSIVAGKHTILLDPFLSDNPASAIAADEVEADFILVSHGHADHVGDTISIAKRTGAIVVANYEICQWLGRQGVENCHAMNTGGGHDFLFGRVQMTIAHHSSTMPDGTCGGGPCGFLVTFPEGNVYFACDTGLFFDMHLIGATDPVLAVLPIGDNFTMGPDDALHAIDLLSPQRVVPVHFDTWPIIEQDVETWSRRVREETEADPVVLEPGETVLL